MTRIVLTLSLLALSSANHVGGQGLKEEAASLTTPTTDPAIHGEESATVSIQTVEKEGSGTIDLFQDILFDPSLVVARVNRDVNDDTDGKSVWSAFSTDVKDEESSNTSEDLNTEEDKYYSEPNWYRRQDWKVEEERPIYKRESYKRFLKYPIFSGR